MEIIIDILRNTFFGLIVITLLIVFIVYLSNQRLALKQNENFLKLKLKRTLDYSYIVLCNFSLFIHFGIFVITGILKGDMPGLALKLNFISIFGILTSLILLTIFFLISVPNIIVLFQFIRNEFGRIVKLNENENTIEIQTKKHTLLIKKNDISHIEFHIMKHFVSEYYELNYIKIIMNDNTSIIFTDLLTDVNGFSALKFMYNGVKKYDLKKYFNKINVC